MLSKIYIRLGWLKTYFCKRVTRRQLALLFPALAAFPEIPARLQHRLPRRCSLSQPGASQGSHPCHRSTQAAWEVVAFGKVTLTSLSSSSVLHGKVIGWTKGFLILPILTWSHQTVFLSLSSSWWRQKEQASQKPRCWESFTDQTDPLPSLFYHFQNAIVQQTKSLFRR